MKSKESNLGFYLFFTYKDYITVPFKIEFLDPLQQKDRFPCCKIINYEDDPFLRMTYSGEHIFL